MAFSFKKFFAGINIVPKSVSTIDSQGDLEVLSSNAGKLNYHNGSSASPMVTEAHAATLINKSIDGLTNTLTNVVPANTATIDTVQTFTNKTIDADSNTITNIEDADIKSAAAISRAKLANGTANHVVINSGTGAFSSEATLAKSRGGSGQDNSSITFPASGTLTTNDGTQTLSNKSFSDAVTLPEIATPSTPSLNNGKIYFKSDGALYQLNDSGTETQLGSSQVVAAQYRTNTGTISNGVEHTVVYTTLDMDTHSAYNNTTGVFTVPVTGIYQVYANTLVSGTEANNNALLMLIRKNGVSILGFVNRIWNTGVDNTNGFVNGKISCIAGDTIDIRLTPVLTAPAYDNSDGFSIISINRV